MQPMPSSLFMSDSATSAEPRREIGARSRENPMCTREYVEGSPKDTLCKYVSGLGGLRDHVVGF